MEGVVVGIFSVCRPFLEMRLSGSAAPGPALAPLGEVETANSPADFAEAPTPNHSSLWLSQE